MPAPISLNNRGRFINFISGINGVTSGGNAIINLPVNQRYHRIILNCTEAGSAAAVSSIITGIRILVNGVTIRDITPANMIKIAQANGYTPLLGELPILFTEPFPTGGTYNEPSDITSWDLYDQSTFSIQLTVAGTVPGITGSYEFDFLRNLGPDGLPFLQVVTQHQFSTTTVVGRNDLTNLPISYPIRRLWLAVGAGTISQVEAYQDGNKVFEATLGQLRNMYRQYGFKFAQTDYTPFVNATGPAALGVSALMEAINYFDGAFLADVDARIWKSLKVGQALILRVTTSNATTLTVIQEAIPGAFAS